MNEIMMTQEQYNAFALAQVDTDGDKCEETCPDCGKLAVRHDFECCHSGSVNAHYTLNCSHCGYHECDQDVCPICDGKYEHNQHLSDEVNQWLRFLDMIEKKLTNGQCVPGLLWSQFKQAMYHQPAVAGLLYDVLDLDFTTDCGKQVVHHVQRTMMDMKFNQRLDAHIQHAKLN